MFKEDEPGDKRINIERTDEALATGATVVASNCPFCMTMLTDGVKAREKEEQVQVLDLAGPGLFALIVFLIFMGPMAKSAQGPAAAD